MVILPFFFWFLDRGNLALLFKICIQIFSFLAQWVEEVLQEIIQREAMLVLSYTWKLWAKQNHRIKKMHIQGKGAPYVQGTPKADVDVSINQGRD